MKHLYLVRHAKSSWKDNNLDDIDRPLNKRGEHDAPFMGKLLKKINVKPDFMISSVANRALTTANIFAKELDFPKDKIILQDSLYLASAGEIINVLSSIDAKAKNIILFGHNPGITDCLNHICYAIVDNMPTCSVACIEFNFDTWEKISDEKGKLKFFEYPGKYNY